jgi:hypothetical protein
MSSLKLIKLISHSHANHLFKQGPLTLVPRTPVAVVEPRSDICPSVDLGFDPGPQGLLQISPGGVGNLESSS